MTPILLGALVIGFALVALGIYQNVPKERLVGYRTILFNGILACGLLLAEVASFMTTVNWREFIPPEYAPWVVIGINVLNIMLRFATKAPTPLREKFGMKP